MSKRYFLAIDLGASSGRAMLGSIENNRLELQEINRFSNPMIEVNGRTHWDLFYLYNQIIISLQEIKSRQIKLTSVGIDTWGVDFVCFGKDGETLRMPYSYRDTHNVGAPERFFKKIEKATVYQKTGIQIMNFNSLFVLNTMLEEGNATYPIIDKILFMPDALSYLLTGKMVTEYTIASTSQMVNPMVKKFDSELLEAIQLSENHFAPIVFAGTEIGKLSASAKHLTGLDDVSVVAVAGHDTASAVLTTPAENRNFAYLSSGTWSLMGIESDEPIINEDAFTHNFTNEGGADGTVRFMKNICGFWLIEQCKKEWGKSGVVSHFDIVDSAQEVTPFRSLINPDAPCFANPPSMIAAIKNYCKTTHQPIPETMGEIARCIYESLAFLYKQVLGDLQKFASFPIETLHIIGGGAQNRLVNAFTANAIRLPVVAGPAEATAIGNLLLQAQASGLVKDKSEIRAIVRNSVESERFEPKNCDVWEESYGKYLSVFVEM
jgi:rhamnulokinase